jgi:TusA-related sulfurtransferase
VTGPEATVPEIALGSRPLPETFAEVESAIERAAQGEALDVTTTDDLIVKYVVPTAALRGVRSSFRRDGEHGWRVTLRPKQQQLTPQ